MKEAKDLVNMPIVSVATGRQIGQVKELLFEPGGHALYGLVLKQPDDERVLLVRRENVRSFGNDAITIEDEAGAEVFDANDRAREIGLLGGSHLGGMKVMDQDGNEIGEVDKVMLNDDGTINCYRAYSGLLGLSHQDFRPDEIVSAGRDAIIVPTRSA